MTTPDPILVLWTRFGAFSAAMAVPGKSDKEVEALIDLRNALDDEAVKVRATTLAGALAALEWASLELRESYLSDAEKENGSNLAHTLLKSVESYLRERPFRLELVPVDDGVATAADLAACAGMAARSLDDAGEPIATVLDAAVRRLRETRDLLAALMGRSAENLEGAA